MGSGNGRGTRASILKQILSTYDNVNITPVKKAITKAINNRELIVVSKHKPGTFKIAQMVPGHRFKPTTAVAKRDRIRNAHKSGKGPTQKPVNKGPPAKTDAEKRREHDKNIRQSEFYSIPSMSKPIRKPAVKRVPIRHNKKTASRA